jgi:hypothetical protein
MGERPVARINIEQIAEANSWTLTRNGSVDIYRRGQDKVDFSWNVDGTSAKWIIFNGQRFDGPYGLIDARRVMES